MKIFRYLFFISLVFLTQLALSQSKPSIMVEPLDPDVPGGTDDQVREWVLTILHGGGGELDTASIKYKGNAAAFGKFWRGDNAGVGIDKGLLLSTGPVLNARGNNETGAATHKFNPYHGPPSGDSSLWRMYRDWFSQVDENAIIPFDTLGDAAVLEFWYKPYGKEINLTYVFGSDEYPSSKFSDPDPDVDLTGYTGISSQMMDFMGVFITNRPNTDTTNLALIVGPDPPPPNTPPAWVNVYEINANKNSALFLPNPGSDDTNLGTEFDGLTKLFGPPGTLVIRKQVTPCVRQRVKIAIADFYFNAPEQYPEYNGYSINSGVFLEAGSFRGDQMSNPHPRWTVDYQFENTSGGSGNFGDQIIENCSDLLVTITLNKPVSVLRTYEIPFRIESTIYRDSIDVHYEGSMGDVLITNDTIVFVDGDSIRTVRVSARNIHEDAATQVKFIYKVDPCDGPLPPIGGGSFSGKIPFVLRHNDPISFTFDPSPGFKQYEAYCKETIDLNVVSETEGGVLPLTYVWPDNPVPPVETYSHTVNNSPDLVTVKVTDGCNNESEGTVKIVNKPIQLQTIPTLSFCAPGMFQEVEAHWMPANDFPDYNFVPNLTNWSNITDAPPSLIGNGNPFTINYDDNYFEQVWLCEYNVTDVCGNGATGTFNVDQTGTLDIGDDKYICEGESVLLITFTPSLGDDPNNYKWYEHSVIPSNQIGTGSSITVIPADTTKYILYILDKCNNVQYDSLIVYVDHFLPEITISPSSAEVCPGEVVTLTANTANVWEWTPGGETTQSITRNETIPGVYTYTLTASSDYCIDKQISATYEVFPQPSPAFSFTPDKEACTGEDIQFTYGSDATGKEFNWNFGDGATATIPNPIHAYTDPNTYNVYLHVQEYICEDDTSITVLVNPLPAPDFTADVFEGCLPVDVQFINQTQDAFPAATYEWNLGDGTSSNVENPSHSYNTAGLFTISLKVSNTERCFAAITKPNLIQVNPNPTADFEADPWISTMDRPDIDFDNLSIADSAWYDFQWDFGDGNSSSDKNPSHTYTAPGDYYISLRVETVNGCWDTTLAMVALTEEVKLFIPNAFTPNGDGVNDVFEIKGTPITDFNLYIYDRWGGKIWSTHNFENQWDGTSDNGNDVPAGSYIYQISGTDYRRFPVSYKGTVTVVR